MANISVDSHHTQTKGSVQRSSGRRSVCSISAKFILSRKHRWPTATLVVGQLGHRFDSKSSLRAIWLEKSTSHKCRHEGRQNVGESADWLTDKTLRFHFFPPARKDVGDNRSKHAQISSVSLHARLGPFFFKSVTTDEVDNTIMCVAREAVMRGEMLALLRRHLHAVKELKRRPLRRSDALPCGFRCISAYVWEFKAVYAHPILSLLCKQPSMSLMQLISAKKHYPSGLQRHLRRISSVGNAFSQPGE